MFNSQESIPARPDWGLALTNTPDTRNLTPETYSIYLSAHSLRHPAPLLESTVFEEV
jgi:hypothetical protein